MDESPRTKRTHQGKLRVSKANLEVFLYQFGLQSHVDSVESWCQEEGAAFMEEVEESVDEIFEWLAIPNDQRAQRVDHAKLVEVFEFVAEEGVWDDFIDPACESEDAEDHDFSVTSSDGSDGSAGGDGSDRKFQGGFHNETMSTTSHTTLGSSSALHRAPTFSHSAPVFAES